MICLIALGLSENKEVISQMQALKLNQVQDIFSFIIAEFPHPTISLELI